MKEINNILFVCTGNSCRSIMAEGYLKKRAKDEKIPLKVRSAGTLSFGGLQPTPEALKLLEGEGIGPEELESKGLTPDFIEWADMILVMEPSHKGRIIEMMPEAEGKVRYLGEFNPERSDMIIPDPIGRPLAFYRASFRLIKQSIEGMLEWLKK